jgi:hypothetical protein
MICAAIPVTAAVGTRLNAKQLDKPIEKRKPIAKITGCVIALLLAASVIYHTFIWRV